MDPVIAWVSLAALAIYFQTVFAVGGARRVSGVEAPQMTGHPQLERAVRVHYNMLEWLPVFLVTLWLFAMFVPAPYARWGGLALGLLWIVGRYLYGRAYMADPSKRSTGFLIQFAACIVLFLGALIGAAWTLIAHG